MKIKICGLKDPDNIKAVTALAPDYAGFIFFGQSLRYAEDLPVSILKDMPATIIKTAVFVNETAETINALIDKFKFDAIQLHGNESPDFCSLFINKVQVIKAFGVGEAFDFDTLSEYADKVDYFLFDTKTKNHGGSGEVFNWSILKKYHLNTPFFLSGGLNIQNLEEVKNIDNPQFYGVDLNSKFEITPGIKDIKLLTKAFNILHKTYTDELRS